MNKKIQLFLTIFFVVASTTIHAQWQQCAGTIGMHIHCMAIKNNLLFAGTDNGIFFSTDSGSTWIPRNNGLTNDTVLGLLITSDHVFAGTKGAGIYTTADSGLTWQAANNGITNNVIHCFTELGIQLFAGADSGKIFSSSDDGLNWTQLNTGIFGTAVYALTNVNNEIFAANIYGIAASIDSGITWTTTNATITNFISFAVHDSEIYAGSGGDGVFYTTDHFATFSVNNNGMSDLIIQSMTTAGNLVFSGSAIGGVYVSIDHSANWTAFNTGLTDFNIPALATGGGYIFAGTASTGIWRRNLTDLTTMQEMEIPGTNELQIFPNPFSTQLHFIYSGVGQQTLVLYDFLGRPVLQQMLTKSTNLHTEQLPNGIYFYELRNGKGVVENGKLLKQ